MFFKTLARLRPGDKVLVVTNPPLLPFLAALTCGIRRAKCILLVHDKCPEALVAAGVLKPNSLATRAFDRCVRRLYRSAEFIVTLGRDMQECVRSQAGGNPRRVVVIPNWADVETIRPQPRAENRLLRELGLLDKFVVQFAGNIGRMQDIESLVKCAEALRDHPNIHFVIVGWGAKRAWLDRIVGEPGHENITLLPSFPREASADILNACDVSISTLLPGMLGVSVPSLRLQRVCCRQAALGRGRPRCGTGPRRPGRGRGMEGDAWRCRVDGRGRARSRRHLARRPRRDGPAGEGHRRNQIPNDRRRRRLCGIVGSVGRRRHRAVACECLQRRFMNLWKVVVFGGSGFIGTHLVKRLVEAGHEVQIADIVPSELFPALYMTCDVRNFDATRKACEGMDMIYNLAALHGDDVQPRNRYYETNVGGAETVCRAAEANGVKRLIFTSSVSVYGLPKEEVDETSEIAPFNDYGYSKSQAEDVYRRWVRADKDRGLVIVRPAVVFGEGNRGNMYVLMRQIARNRFVMVGNGRNRKSVAYVQNVVAFLEFVSRFETGERLFNYADKPDYDTNTLTTLLYSMLGRRRHFQWWIPCWCGLGFGMACDAVSWLTRRPLAVNVARVQKFCGSTQVSAAKAFQTGFSPPVSLEDGLARTVDAEFTEYRNAN